MFAIADNISDLNLFIFSSLFSILLLLQLYELLSQEKRKIAMYCHKIIDKNTSSVTHVANFLHSCQVPERLQE